MKVAHAANILWRTATFYLGLIIGGLVSAFYRTSPKQMESTPHEYATFVDLQLSTMEERRESSDTAFATKQISRREIEERLKKLRIELFTKKKKRIKRRKRRMMINENNVILGYVSSRN